MEKIYNLSNMSVMVAKWSRNYKLLLFTLFAFGGLFGVNEKAWAYWTKDKDGNTIADNTSVKGYVSNSGSTYYVLDESSQKSKYAGTAFEISFDEMSLSGPGAKVSFEAKRQTAGTGNLALREGDNSGWTKIWEKGVTTSYKSYTAPEEESKKMSPSATKIQFYLPSGSLQKYIKNVKVTMGSYCVPEVSSIAFGSNTYLTSESKTLKIYWSNMGNQTISKSGDTDRFTVSMTTVPSKAGYYGNTVITITYNRDKVGTNHTMKLTINGQEVTVTGTTTKGTPSIDCSKVSASGLTYGQKLSASTISGPNATYKNNSYPGTYSWKRSDASTHVAQGCTNYVVKFTPSNSNLNSVECAEVKVPITKVSQTITWNQTTKYFIDENVTLSASTSGHDASVYFTSGDESIATISGNTVVMHKAGDVVITAHADATCNYNVASTVSHTLQFRNRPVIVWNKTGEDDHIYSGDTLVNLATATFGNKTFNLPFEYSVNPTGILIPTTNQDSLIANPLLTEAANCEVTATFNGNGTYCAVEGSHTYWIEAKVTPKFLLEGEDLPESPVKELKLKVGETANMTFEGTDESIGDNGPKFTYPTETQFVSYTHDSEAKTGVITGTAAGNEEIQFSQTGTTTIFEHTRKIHVYVSKHEVTLSELLEEGYEVGDSIAAVDMYSVNAPGEGQPAQKDVIISSSAESVFAFENGKWRAKNEGDAWITFAQENNDYWTGDTISVKIHVSKKTPDITWHLEDSYPWGAIVETPVSSTNEELPFTVKSNNPAVADIVNGRMEVYKTGDVTFTLSQPGNYKWKDASTNLTKSISCYRPNNHVPFTISSSNKADIVIYNESHANWDNNGYKMGDNRWVLSNAPDAYIIIGFTGIPDKLTFTKKCDTYWGQLPVDGDCLFEVYESTTNGNWGSPIWSYNKKEESRDVTNVPQLQPSTRYLKLRYYGTVYGHFNNIQISQRKEIVAPASYVFGNAYVGNKATERTINVDWYNVKTCSVALSGTNADCFELVDESIASSLDNYGTAGIRVNYKHDKVGTHTATLTITSTDDPAKTAKITLSGKTDKAIQEIIWREDITPLPLDEPYAGVAIATSGLDVVLTAETPDIVEIDGTTIKGVGVGSTRLFAYQAGDTKWEAVNETITVEVTNKHVQHIIWNDKLSNIKRESGKTVTKPLTAYSDADKNLPITYELDNDAKTFASLSGSTLTINGWGTGYITASQAGTDDLVGVSKTMKIVSRDPDAGCDPLVLDEAGEVTLHTIDSKTFDLNGEPAELRFEAKCYWDALWGLWVYQNIGGSWSQIRYIERSELSTSYQKFKMPVDIRATQIKISADAGSTMTRTFKNVEVSTAKYLKLKENNMDFSAVEYGQVENQQFIIDFSNITGALDVALQNESEQFAIVTETVGEDCGDVNHNAVVKVRCTGRTVGTENNTIIISNKDQTLEIPVSATVIPTTQVITWDAANPANVNTTDNVVLSATATSSLPVSFKSSDEKIAETYDKGDGTWGLTIHKGGNITITATQAGNGNYGAAEDVEHTYIISRVTPEITSAPTASDLVLPNVALSNSNLSGGVASVDGSFAWANPQANATYGTHAYQVVFTPENEDWYTTATCEVNVTVEKASQTITWDFNELTMYCNADITFDATASSGLKVAYTTSDDKIAYVDGENKLRIIKGGEVTITARQEGDETYAAAAPVAKDLIINRETPEVVEFPEAAPMKIGKLRSDASLTGGRAELNGVKADGSFAWKNGNEEVENVAGNFMRTVVFTPGNTNYYNSVEFEMEVTVEKYAPVILSHTLTASSIEFPNVLGTSELSGTVTAQDQVKYPMEWVEGSCAWKEPSVVLRPGTQKAIALFIPDDTDWYTSVEIPVTVEVTGGYVFNGGSNSTWTEKGNWEGNLIPTGKDDPVLINESVEISTEVSVGSLTIKEGVDLVVKDGGVLTIGASDSYLREQYGNLHVENGGKVNLGEGKLNVNNFILDAKLGNTSNAAASGQVSGAEQLNVNGDVYFQLALDPSGECSQGWYDFTVPFPVDVMTGITRLDNTTHSEKTIKNEVNYAIMDFSESRHVESGYGWKKFRGVMQPGKCYSITIDDVDNVYRFKKTKTGEFNNQNGETLAYTDSELSRRGWNGLGNGTLKHIDLGSETIEEVQIYNHSSNSYTAVDIDEFTYVVGSAYFVQAPVANTVISYNAGTKVNDYLRAPRRVAASENSAYKLTLTREGANVAADRLYVGASEEASDSYEIARDLAKFGTPTDSKVAQIWANAYGMKLCDIDMPMTDNAAECTVGLFAPQAGSYELKIERAPEDANLYLTYNGEIIWDLTASPYLFDLAKGTTEGYGLRIEAQAPQMPTGIEESEFSNQSSVRKVLIDNKVYIVTPEGKMYNIIGKGVKF